MGRKIPMGSQKKQANHQDDKLLTGFTPQDAPEGEMQRADGSKLQINC